MLPDMAVQSSPLIISQLPLRTKAPAINTSLLGLCDFHRDSSRWKRTGSATHATRALHLQWNAPGRVLLRNGSVKCKALGETAEQTDNRTVYQGTYGPWTVDPLDVREVILYRSGLVTAAVSFVIAASYAFLPDDTFLKDFIRQNADFLYALGSGGLGLSLYLIHIYVTPIKRTLQALWAIGVIGSLGTFFNLAQPANESLIQYVIENPVAVWFVGPLFAALTGLVFKEGLCYGKLEAGILTFVIPTVLLGHLTGLMDDTVKLGILGLWMILFVVFSGRKFTQPIKDDIGDKSVFMFNALPKEEKEALVLKLEEESGQKPN